MSKMRPIPSTFIVREPEDDDIELEDHELQQNNKELGEKKVSQKKKSGNTHTNNSEADILIQSDEDSDEGPRKKRKTETQYDINKQIKSTSGIKKTIPKSKNIFKQSSQLNLDDRNSLLSSSLPHLSSSTASSNGSRLFKTTQKILNDNDGDIEMEDNSNTQNTSALFTPVFNVPKNSDKNLSQSLPSSSTSSTISTPTPSTSTFFSSPFINEPNQDSSSSTNSSNASLSVLDSYIEHNAKTMSKILQPTKTPVFLLRPKSFNPTLSDSKKLIGNSSLTDTSESLGTISRKTFDVVKDEPHLQPKTVILNNISELSVPSQIQTRPLKSNPNLMALDIGTLPNFEDNIKKAKEGLENTIIKAINHKIVALSENDLVFAPDTQQIQSKRIGSTTITNVNSSSSSTTTTSSTSSQQPNKSSIQTNKNNANTDTNTNNHQTWLRVVTTSFTDLMQNLVDEFYEPNQNVNLEENVFDLNYVKQTLQGTFKEKEDSTKIFEGKIDGQSVPLYKNPNLRSPTPEQLTVDIPRLSRLYIQNFLRAPAFPFERPCRNKQRCQAYTKWHAENISLPFSERNKTNRTSHHKLSETPFELREFFLPKEMEDIMNRKKAGATYEQIMGSIKEKICILCLRLSIQQLVDYQKANIDKQPWFHVQNHGNIFDAPGEYKHEYQKGCNSEWSSIIRPILSFDLNHYMLGNFCVFYTEKPSQTSPNETVILSQTLPQSIDEKGGLSNHTQTVVTDLFGTSDVYFKIVPGLIEKEEIIFQPEIQNPQVKNLVNLSYR